MRELRIALFWIERVVWIVVKQWNHVRHKGGTYLLSLFITWVSGYVGSPLLRKVETYVKSLCKLGSVGLSETPRVRQSATRFYNTST